MSYAAEEQIPDECESCANCGSSVPLVPLNKFLAVRDGANPTEVILREEMHPRVDPHLQRVATGNLFGYVGTESGQYFMGEIWCKDDSAWQTLCQLTGVTKKEAAFPLRLGKATRRGYGLVTVYLEEVKSDEAQQVPWWRGKPLKERVIEIDKPITLTLLTDTIVTDVWGRFRQTVDASFLVECIGSEFVACDGSPIQVFCKSGYVDNFNNHLGLPRWRDIALKAGSAVGFRLKKPPEDDAPREQWLDSLYNRLGELEETGIGLRRNEGFGQVAFNHPVYNAGQGVSGTNIQIPPELQLAEEPQRGTAKEVQAEFKMVKDWVMELREKKKFAVTCFCKGNESTNEEEKNWGAVARWLHNEAEQPIEHLKEGLDGFGYAALLTDLKRDKTSFFAEEGKKGICHLKLTFDEVTAQNPSDRIRRIMIEMLADRLMQALKKGGS